MKKTRRTEGCTPYPDDREHEGEETTAAAEESVEEEEAVEAHGHSSSDVCQSLLERYGKSSAPHHRHLCASARAMRSILSDEGLPLTPASYLVAVLSAIHDSDGPAAISPLASFLSILLRRIPVNSFPASKLKDALFSTVIPILRSHGCLPTPTLRSLVSTLGFLILGMDDTCTDDDRSSAKSALEILLKYAVDRRPKVRKSAQSYVEKSFRHFKGTSLGKEYRKMTISMFKEYVSLALRTSTGKYRKGDASKPPPEHVEALQMLHVTKLILPNVPKKKAVEVLPEVYAILQSLVVFRAHALSLLEVSVECARLDDLVSEADEMMPYLAACVRTVNNRRPPDEIIVTVSSLFKKILNRICPAKPSTCMRSLPAIFSSLADYLASETDAAWHVSEILKELINCHIHQDVLLLIEANASFDDYMFSCSPEAMAVQTVSGLLEKRIRACSGIPDRHTLSVLSVLFLKLGSLSFHFVKDIVLEQLGQRIVDVRRGSPDIDPLQECVGSAIVAVGPEKILQLLPISLDEEKMVCSNSWIVPLLRKYVSGASLQFFMEHIIPLVTYLKKKCKKGKKSPATVKDIQLCIQGLWDLLPAFCHHAVDVSDNFCSLAKLLVDSLREDASLHKPIAMALQVLVKENKRILQREKDGEDAAERTGIQYDPGSFGLRNSACCFSKKEASKSMKVLASSSLDLFEALFSAFRNSAQENRPELKGAIECLASSVSASHLQSVFDLLLETFASEDGVSEDGTSDGVKNGQDMGEDERRSMIMGLASCIVVGADRGLLTKIYNYIKPFVLNKDRGCNLEAYLVLCKALKEWPWLCAEKMDELLDMLIGKKPSDANIFRIHLSCLHFLLVYLLRNEEGKKEDKAFLILNEIILRLKDPAKEVREAAYDMLLGLSGSLSESKLDFPGSPLHKLLAMIMGYFSGASPQIIGGAVAALSVLVYKDPSICLYEPTLLPSITSLLRKKENEIIKASLGFVKVLVSSMASTELKKFLPDIVNGVLLWSAVSKNHFRTKVKIIFQIMMRRCGAATINMAVPEKYKGFIKTIEDHRKKKPSSKQGGSSDDKKMPGDPVMEGDRKRKLRGVHPHGPPNNSKEQKRRKEFMTAHNDREKESSRDSSTSEDVSQCSTENLKSGQLGQKRRRDDGNHKYRRVWNKRHVIAKMKQRNIAKRTPR